MSDQDIINLGQKISDFGAVHQEKMDRLDAAADAANQAAIQIRHPSLTQSIHIDAQNGDDENEGAENAPVKSFERATELIRSGHRVILWMYGSLVADYSRVYYQPPSILEIRSAPGTGPHELVFTDAINSNSRPGGFRLHGFCKVQFQDVTPVLETNRSIGPIEVIGITFVNLRDGTLLRRGGGDASLISSIFGGKIIIEDQDFIIDPSAEGYLAVGTPAGVDPNLSRHVLQSSITSG